MKKGCLFFLLIIIVIVLFVGIRILDGLGGSDYGSVDRYENVPKNNYDFSLLEIDTNGRISHPKAKIGIDVSSHKGDIDWSAVANDNVEFAFIRTGYRGSTEGNIYIDKKSNRNIINAKENGIDVGIYFFSQAINEKEARSEAEFMIEKAKEYNISKDMPIVYDLEDVVDENARTKDLTYDKRTELAMAFGEEIKDAGYDVCIYGNKTWLVDKFDLNEISKEKIWLAAYEEIPNFAYDFEIWQYTEEGKVSGIKGNVDLDLWFD